MLSIAVNSIFFYDSSENVCWKKKLGCAFISRTVIQSLQKRRPEKVQRRENNKRARTGLGVERSDLPKCRILCYMPKCRIKCDKIVRLLLSTLDVTKCRITFTSAVDIVKTFSLFKRKKEKKKKRKKRNRWVKKHSKVQKTPGKRPPV
jgi:hypothetical protein